MAPNRLSSGKCNGGLKIFRGFVIAPIRANSPGTIAPLTSSFTQEPRRPLGSPRWRAKRAGHRWWEFAGVIWTTLSVMTRNRGRGKTARTRWRMQSKNVATANCPSLAGRLHASPEACTVGREYLRNCFAFIARFGQTTADFDGERRPQAVPHSGLSQIRPRSGKKALLRYRLSWRPNRSRLRGPRIVCGFSHHLLYRSRTRIMFSARGGR